MDEMNEKLENLYGRNKSEFVRISNLSSKEVPIHGPFLMSPSNLYFNSKIKLLVVGKETYGWPCHANDISLQMSKYEEFNVGQFYYSSPFWNVIRKVENILGNPAYSCAWTNLSKFDVNQGSPYGEYERLISNLDTIILEEIKILAPDLCLFFTGPNLDYRIKKTFQNGTFSNVEGWIGRALSKLNHSDLPMSFRTYHPNYLRRGGYESDFMHFLKSEIRN